MNALLSATHRLWQTHRPSPPFLLGLSLLLLLMCWILSRHFWSTTGFTTTSNSQSSSETSELSSAISTAPPVDLTKIGATGAMPPPGHDIYNVMPVSRPSELSVSNAREGDLTSVLFLLTDFDCRLLTLESKLNVRRN